MEKMSKTLIELLKRIKPTTKTGIPIGYAFEAMDEHPEDFALAMNLAKQNYEKDKATPRPAPDHRQD